MSDTVVKIENLVKNYAELRALDHLDLEIKEGEVFGLLGPNGSGKTTTINVITGIYRANEGTIRFDGQEIQDMAPHKIAELGLRRTYQNLNLFRKLTIRENIMMGAQHEMKAGLLRTIFDGRKFRAEEEELQERSEEVIKLLGIGKFADNLVASEPYGIQKLTSVGMALIDHPKLLLLDEPAAGLNPSERSGFVDIIFKIREMGTKILIIEHNMDVVMNISKKITVLNFGSKIAEGTPEEIRNDDTVIKAYLGRKYYKPES
jgi:ABC-type branched-subunit amino acid transport system ATPase component